MLKKGTGTPDQAEITAFLGKGTTFKGVLSFEGTIRVDGKVVGNIIATQMVHVLAPGTVNGNIKTPRLIIEEGVLFDGKCEMAGERKAAEQKVVSLTAEK